MRLVNHTIWLCIGLAGAVGCGKPERSVREQLSAADRLAPELEGGLTWLNSAPVRLADLRGKVVLLDFFEYSCVNCIRTFPYLKEWQQRYADQGLVVIGVHTPQYGFSMDPQNVLAGVKRFELQYPIVVDSDFTIAEAYQNRFWPRKFLIDQEGRIRFDHTGEGAYAETEQKIQELLREVKPDSQFPEPMAPLHDFDKPGVVCYPITPELYLGKIRGQLGNEANAVSNSPSMFVLPAETEEGKVYAVGEWAIQSEYLRHTRDMEKLEDFLLLRYRAVEVNVVMKPEENFWLRVFVKQDGDWLRSEIAGADIKYDEDNRSFVEVKSARMYNLIAKQPYGAHELRLFLYSRGLSVYSFSFGTCEIPSDVDRLKPERKPL